MPAERRQRGAQSKSGRGRRPEAGDQPPASAGSAAARTRQLEALRAVTEEVTRELDLSRLLDLIIRRAAQLLRTDAGIVWLLDAAGRLLSPAAIVGPPGGVVSKPRAVGEGLVGAVAATRRGILVNDYPGSPYALPDTLAVVPIQAILGEPLLSRETLYGVVTVRDTRPGRRFTPGDQELLRLFAQQASIAVQNARLYEAEQERRRQVEALRAVGEELTRELDLDRLLTLITQRANQLLGTSTATVRLWDEASQLLVPRGWAGSAGAVPGRIPLRLGEGVAGTVAQRREGLIVNDFPGSPYATPRLLRAGHTAVLGEPLLYRERLVGVLTVDNLGTDRRFAPEDGDVLRSLANQAAIAIENARLFETSRAELADRRRAEEALRASQDFLESVFRSAPIGIGVVTARVLGFANQALCQMTGYAPEELAGQSARLLYPSDEDYQRVGVEKYAQIRERGSGAVETRFRRKDGTVLEVLLSSTPIQPGDPSRGVTFTALDITDRKRAERAFQARTRQLEAVREVSAEIARELDLPAVLQLITRRAVALAGADSGEVWLWEPEGEFLTPGAWHGLEEWVAEVRLRRGEGAAGRAAAEERGLIVNDYGRWGGAAPAFLAGGRIGAVLAEPLRYRERLVGVIAVNRHLPGGRFTEEDLEGLRLFGPQAAIAIENARLHAAALQRGEELAALLRAANSLRGDLALPAVLERILAEAMRVTGSSHVKILLVDSAAGLLRPGALRGEAMAHQQAMPIGTGLSGVVAATGQPVYSPDTREDPRNLYRETDRTLGIVSYLGLPITIRGQVAGVLAFNTTAPRAYPPEEVAYLAAFADQAAAAIETATLFEAEQERRRQLEAVRAVGGEIARELDLPTLLDLIHQRLAKLLGTACSVVFLWDEAGQCLVPAAWHGHGPRLAELRLSLGQAVAGTVAERREGMLVRDVPSTPYAHPIFLGDPPPTEVLAEPLIHRDRLLGVLSVDDRGRGRGFSEADQAVLRLFAPQAAIAIENARLYRAAQTELAERQRAEARLLEQTARLEAVRAIGEEIARELDLQRLLGLIMRMALRLAEADSGSLWLWEEAEERLVATTWEPAEEWMRGRRQRLGEGVAGLAAERRTGVIENDFPRSPHAIPTVLEHLEATRVLGEPLLYRERLVGVIGLRRHGSAPPFTEQDLATVALFAAQAAIAIENARLYQELKRSFDRLQEAQAELVRSEKLRGLGQMAAGIAHDLNNTLAAILGQVELLRLRVADPTVREALGPLETAATDGAAVVRRLQDFARQRAAAPLVPCDLATLAREAVELTRPRWQDEAQRRGAPIEVALDLPVGLPAILGHPPELREALTNLIFNAVDAMPDGGTLTFSGRVEPGGRRQAAGGSGVWLPDGRVRNGEAPGGQSQLATRQSPMVELAVTDTGVGIPPEIQERIFDPFFTTKGLHGTGLGLSAVYGILERHGGRIGVASTPGQGATFTLTFQAAPAAAPAAAEAPVPPVAARRLLLIEDEPAVRKSLAGLLRARGHTVLEAADGPAGLARLAAEPVDLLLTDLGMPGMTGWEVARAAAALRPGLPVVLLTGWGESVAADRPADVAVARLLSKPVRGEALLAVIRELTPCPDGPPSAA